MGKKREQIDELSYWVEGIKADVEELAEFARHIDTKVNKVHNDVLAKVRIQRSRSDLLTDRMVYAENRIARLSVAVGNITSPPVVKAKPWYVRLQQWFRG